MLAWTLRRFLVGLDQPGCQQGAYVIWRQQLFRRAAAALCLVRACAGFGIAASEIEQYHRCGWCEFLEYRDNGYVAREACRLIQRHADVGDVAEREGRLVIARAGA